MEKILTQNLNFAFSGDKIVPLQPAPFFGHTPTIAHRPACSKDIETTIDHTIGIFVCLSSIVNCTLR